MLRVVNVYPDLLGTYGDRGNGLVLRFRAQRRGIEVVLDEVPSDLFLPVADIYCVGGGEDGPQQLAAARLDRDGTLQRAADDGAVVLAVCAGLQVLGRSFPSADGHRAEGLGIFGVDTVASSEPRAVGEVVVDAGPLGLLSGFENHAGRTVRDANLDPIGRVVAGIGNGDGTDGVLMDRRVGTYLHGPVLARNPRLADYLLGLALDKGELAPLGAGPAELLHDERLSAHGSGQFRR
jgi:hypothetical protein